MSKKPKQNSERVALLDDYDSDEDDFFLKGPPKSSEKIQAVQSQVQDVVGVMKQNIDKVVERGDCLDDLQDKSDNLADGARNFSNRAVRLRKKMWWNNLRTKIFIALILIVLILIIIISATRKKN